MTGVIWFDKTKQRDPEQNIILALEYFRRKFNREPQLVLIHPGCTELEAVNGVAVEAKPDVLKYDYQVF